ncbi:protein of unknown function [Catalinimonas alkaloidigena]|uniref:DUF4340 domain-containing protein n=1 Tax=Catalinimonas alkaloidigena TaxID=1075417 RepID=A0A1G9PH41_9BACT|nr:DUF4340 domain-containing protein [Catalinimonas alkaloidigena]SDL98059.1 protein of unknown function [Catalinimonas alkaloidigena]
MKKTIFLIFLLAGLAAGAWWALRKHGGRTTLQQEETAFQVEDTAAVDRLFVAGKDNQTALLERQPDGRWLLNQQYAAAPAKVELLLRTLRDLTVKRPLGQAERENMIRELAVEHRKVEVYQHGQLTKVFFLGNETNDERGNYALMKGAEQPYVVYLPGFNGYLTPRFMIAGAEWRDKEVFRVPLASLRQIAVQYPKNPAAGFTLRQEGGRLALDDLPQADPQRLEAYAELFEKGLYVENYLSEQATLAPYRDSLRAEVPDVVLQLAATRNEPVQVQVYYLPGNQDRVAGLLGEQQELVTIQWQLLEKMVQPRSFFNTSLSD